MQMARTTDEMNWKSHNQEVDVMPKVDDQVDLDSAELVIACEIATANMPSLVTDPEYPILKSSKASMEQTIIMPQQNFIDAKALT